MTKKIIKVCGIKSEEAADTAISNGASLIGTILVPNRARTVKPEIAQELSKLCHQKRVNNGSKYINSNELLNYVQNLDIKGPEWFEKVSEIIVENGPYLVGVFRNQSIEDVSRISKELNIDIIQLHGSEDINQYIEALELPVIPRFVLNKPGIEEALTTHKFLLPLLDSESGGEGKLINWDDAAKFGKEMNARYILAGGLNPKNVIEALSVDGCCGVDVSGGVETNGEKDNLKIQQFVKNGKSSYI